MSWIKGQGLGDLVYQDHDVLPENALLKVAQLFVGIDVVQVAHDGVSDAALLIHRLHEKSEHIQAVGIDHTCFVEDGNERASYPVDVLHLHRLARSC